MLLHFRLAAYGALSRIDFCTSYPSIVWSEYTFSQPEWCCFRFSTRCQESVSLAVPRPLANNREPGEHMPLQLVRHRVHFAVPPQLFQWIMVIANLPLRPSAKATSVGKLRSQIVCHARVQTQHKNVTVCLEDCITLSIHLSPAFVAPYTHIMM